MIGYILGGLGVLGLFRVGSAIHERNEVELLGKLPPEVVRKIVEPPPPPKPADTLGEAIRQFLEGGRG